MLRDFQMLEDEEKNEIKLLLQSNRSDEQILRAKIEVYELIHISCLFQGKHEKAFEKLHE